jgi:hypothetical protein
VQSNLILDFWHNCINRLVVTAPIIVAWECMADLFLSCVVCARLGMAAGIDGARLMKAA